MIALTLLACTPPAPVETSDTAHTGGGVDTGAPAPTLTSPVPATDLDPAPDVLHVQLTAAPHSWEGGVDGYAYNGQVPGPTLRARVGDTLRVDLDNQLDMPTTIHWHGVDVPYAMDGAGWQIEPVPAGGSFTYTFPLTHPGTFWYHPHFNTEHQVDRGLYGVLIVEDPADPPADRELVVVFDGPDEVADVDAHPHVVPSPEVWLLNGLRAPVWRPTAGENVRVRMVNASNAGYLALDEVRVIAHDRGLLPQPDTQVVLAPGDRAELDWAVGPEPTSLSAVPWSNVGATTYPAVELLSVSPQGSDQAPPPLPIVFADAAPTPDPGHTDLRYTFTGSPTEGWEINGQTWPDIVPDTVEFGRDIVLEIRNPSPSHHPFHLHGLDFEVLSVDGIPPTQRTIEDTFDVGTQQTVRLRVTADNPGDWMSHCHILPHAHDGMMTVLSVVHQ